MLNDVGCDRDHSPAGFAWYCIIRMLLTEAVVRWVYEVTVWQLRRSLPQIMGTAVALELVSALLRGMVKVECCRAGCAVNCFFVFSANGYLSAALMFAVNFFHLLQ